MVYRKKRLITRHLLLLFVLLWSNVGYGQEAITDTLPFSMDRSLLVIAGKLNGIPTRFAFDTGASFGVATSRNIAQANIKETDNEKKIIDANQTISKLKRIEIDSLSIGRFEATRLQAVAFDMPYLVCNDLFLLGQDFIKGLNWKIDFDKSLVYLSNQPFEVSAKAQTWAIKNLARPTIPLALGSKIFKDCLIDFGYTGVLDAKVSDKDLLKITNNETNRVVESLSASMGLMGWGEPKLGKNWVLDSVQIQGVTIRKIPINVQKDTDTKLGVQFFKRYCSVLVLNHATHRYHLYPRESYNMVKGLPYDLNVAYKESKLVVIGKNISPNSTAHSFELGEQIKGINNRTIADFADECAFLNWYMFELSDEKILIEKLNGEKIWIAKGVLK